MKKGWLFLTFVILFSACSTKNIETPQNISQRKILEVPYIPQQDYYCGPSSILMILKYLKSKGYIKDTPSFEDIVKRVYIPSKKGTLQIELKSIVRDYNLIYFEKKAGIKEILKLIDEDIPVLVLLNLAFEKYPIWHYSVVFGYDLNKKEIYLRSREKVEIFSFRSFENIHKKAGNWTLIITSYKKIPTSITKKDLLKTVIEFENAKKYRLIIEICKNALNRWENDFDILTALANSYYLSKDFENAKDIYEKILKIKEDPLILNNLSLTYMHLKECNKAKESIKKALNLDPKNRKFYEETLKEIFRNCR